MSATSQFKRPTHALTTLCLSLFAATALACAQASAAPPKPRTPATLPMSPATSTEDAFTPRRTSEGVADLPFAQGKVFRTLDDYLEHMKRLGQIDYPFWEEISPGHYRKMMGRRPPGSPPPEEASRADLEHRYGFR